MARYVNQETLSALIESRNRIFPERNRMMEESGIDILDNDTLSSLSIWEIVNEYDSDFTVNFARNGEDGQSNGVITEHKCSSIPPRRDGSVRFGAFQFHAMGQLEYPRYILAARRKDTLEMQRLYDISNPENVQKIINCLMEQRQEWLREGQKDHAKMKRDVIYLQEQFLQELLIQESTVINGCAVYRG
jgi:hypothetical protein